MEVSSFEKTIKLLKRRKQNKIPTSDQSWHVVILFCRLVLFSFVNIVPALLEIPAYIGNTCDNMITRFKYSVYTVTNKNTLYN